MNKTMTKLKIEKLKLEFLIDAEKRNRQTLDKTDEINFSKQKEERLKHKLNAVLRHINVSEV